jgi:hypothetical protein
MRLKLSRSQKTGGMITKKVIFILSASADYSNEEQANIKKYALGTQNIYDSEAARKHGANAANQSGGVLKSLASAAMAKMALSITIDSLGQGHQVECQDLDELLGAEEAIRAACENLKGYLQIADTFDGREQVVEY